MGKNDIAVIAADTTEHAETVVWQVVEVAPQKIAQPGPTRVHVLPSRTAAFPLPADLGFKLCANFRHDDELSFDLYGTRDEDGEVSVETVMIAGTFHNVTTLLSPRQLDNLSRYVELKDSKIPAHQTWANTHRSEAQRY